MDLLTTIDPHIIQTILHSTRLNRALYSGLANTAQSSVVPAVRPLWTGNEEHAALKQPCASRSVQKPRCGNGMGRGICRSGAVPNISNIHITARHKELGKRTFGTIAGLSLSGLRTRSRQSVSAITEQALQEQRRLSSSAAIGTLAVVPCMMAAMLATQSSTTAVSDSKGKRYSAKDGSGRCDDQGDDQGKERSDDEGDAKSGDRCDDKCDDKGDNRAEENSNVVLRHILPVTLVRVLWLIILPCAGLMWLEFWDRMKPRMGKSPEVWVPTLERMQDYRKKLRAQWEKRGSMWGSTEEDKWRADVAKEKATYKRLARMKEIERQARRELAEEEGDKRQTVTSVGV